MNEKELSEMKKLKIINNLMTYAAHLRDFGETYDFLGNTLHELDALRKEVSSLRSENNSMIELIRRQGLEFARVAQQNNALRNSQSSIVDDYYRFRYEDVKPDAKQTIKWLASEFGEMIEAWMEQQTDLTPLERQVFEDYVRLGKVAENLVRNDRAWIRNNDRNKTPNLPNEIGDVQMMLIVLAQQCGLPDPNSCMAAKMKSKGFSS